MIDTLPFVPSAVTVSGSVASALVGAQVVQLGFEAKLLVNVTTLKTRMDMQDDDEEEADGC